MPPSPPAPARPSPAMPRASLSGACSHLVARGIAAGAGGQRVRCGYTVGVQFHHAGAPGAYPLLADAHVEQPAGQRLRGIETVEQEIAEAVDDGLAVIALG